MLGRNSKYIESEDPQNVTSRCAGFSTTRICIGWQDWQKGFRLNSYGKRIHAEAFSSACKREEKKYL